MRSIVHASMLIATCLLMLPVSANAGKFSSSPAFSAGNAQSSPLNLPAYRHLAEKLAPYNVTGIEIVTTLTPNNLRPMQPAIQNASGGQARAIEKISSLLSFVTLIPGMDLNQSYAQNVACISLPARWATNRVDISMGSGGDSDSFYLLEVKLSNQCTARGVLQLKLRTGSGPEETLQEITLSSGTPVQYLWSNPISAGTARHLIFRLANSWRTRHSDIKRLVSFGFKHTRLYRISVESSDGGGTPQQPTGNFQPQPGASTPQLPSGTYQPAPSGDNSGGLNLPSGTYQPAPVGGGSSDPNLPSGTLQRVPSSGDSSGPGLPSGTFQPAPFSGDNGSEKGTCKSNAQCNDGDPCTNDRCISGKCTYRPSASSRCVDRDKDGYPASQDCNDRNPRVFPGAREICGDRIDNNCNRKVDEGCISKRQPHKNRVISGQNNLDNDPIAMIKDKPGSRAKTTYTGTYRGVVKSRSRSTGRVRVSIPALPGGKKSIWTNPSALMNGGSRGSLMIPKVGDEVLVEFTHGDPDRPVWTGRASNGRDRVPEGGVSTKQPRKKKVKSGRENLDSDPIAMIKDKQKKAAERKKAAALKKQQTEKKHQLQKQDRETANAAREKKRLLQKQKRKTVKAKRDSARKQKAEQRKAKKRAAERLQLKSRSKVKAGRENLDDDPIGMGVITDKQKRVAKRKKATVLKKQQTEKKRQLQKQDRETAKAAREKKRLLQKQQRKTVKAKRNSARKQKAEQKKRATAEKRRAQKMKREADKAERKSLREQKAAERLRLKQQKKEAGKINTKSR